MADYETMAIERIRMASAASLRTYEQPIVCTYSGGKDSDVLIELFLRSGVPFEVHNSHTTVDAPQTVYHIRDKFKQLEERGIKCTIEYPELTMWQLIVKKKMPPTRMARYCCSYLKEGSCSNRMISTGVRWAESNARRERAQFEVIGRTKADKIVLNDEEMSGKPQKDKYTQMTIPGIETQSEVMLMNDNLKKRKFIEHCNLKAKTVVNPIVDWPDDEIWKYIESEKIETNILYQLGFCRVGCIGCPMASKMRYKEFEMFPTYKRAYIKSFDRMLEAMRNDETGRIPSWKSGEEVFSWWMEEKAYPGQMSFEDVEIIQ